MKPVAFETQNPNLFYFLFVGSITMSSKNKNKNLIIIAASLLLLLTFTIVFSALLPTIFQLHSSLFLSTIAICASIAISVIFTTCIKILWKLTSSSDQTETQETQETQAQSSVESGVPYRLFDFALTQINQIRLSNLLGTMTHIKFINQNRENIYNNYKNSQSDRNR